MGGMGGRHGRRHGRRWAAVGGMGGGMGRRRIASSQSPAGRGEFGLRPARHIAGFSIRKEDGIGDPPDLRGRRRQARDTVVLKLTGPVPEGASLWYGYGLDPYCNLTDGLDMAVPVFGPVALDDGR